MKLIQFIFVLIFANVQAHAAQASSATKIESGVLVEKIQNVFIGNSVDIYEYNDLLKLVVVNSNAVYFASHDGRYIFGDVVLDSEQKINLVEEEKSKQRIALLQSQAKSLFVSYPSVGKPRHTLTVFTDIDCPYCRKFHNSIDDLNKRGISINYVMLPRPIANPSSYSKTLSALCSKNPAETITLAMRKQEIPIQQCDTTQLEQQRALAQSLEINATPTIVLPTGQLQMGLTETEKLVSMLEEVE